MVECNNAARQILKFDSQPSTGTKPSLAYQEKGQIIALADTRLDGGERARAASPCVCNRGRG